MLWRSQKQARMACDQQVQDATNCPYVHLRALQMLARVNMTNASWNLCCQYPLTSTRIWHPQFQGCVSSWEKTPEETPWKCCSGLSHQPSDVCPLRGRPIYPTAFSPYEPSELNISGAWAKCPPQLSAVKSCLLSEMTQWMKSDQDQGSTPEVQNQPVITAHRFRKMSYDFIDLVSGRW